MIAINSEFIPFLSLLLTCVRLLGEAMGHVRPDCPAKCLANRTRRLRAYIFPRIKRWKDNDLVRCKPEPASSVLRIFAGI